MIMLYEIYMAWMEMICFSYHHTVTRSNGYKLYKSFCQLNCRKYFFSQQTINDWSSLPRETIESVNVWIFNPSLTYIGNRTQVNLNIV